MKENYKFGQVGYAWDSIKSEAVKVLYLGEKSNFPWCIEVNNLDKPYNYKNFSTEKPKVYKNLDQSVFDGMPSEVKLVVVNKNGSLNFATGECVNKTVLETGWIIDYNGTFLSELKVKNSNYKPMTKLKREFPEVKPNIDGFEFAKIDKVSDNLLQFNPPQFQNNPHDLCAVFDLPNFAGFWYLEEPNNLYCYSIAYKDSHGDIAGARFDKYNELTLPKYVAFTKQ